MPIPDSTRGSAGVPAQQEAVFSVFGAERVPRHTPDPFTARASATKLAPGLAPGQPLWANLGASLLTGCRHWAATLAVPIDDLAVDITTESTNLSGSAAVEQAPSGGTRLRIELHVKSGQPKARVRAVVETAYRSNTKLARIARDVERVFLVHIEDSAVRADRSAHPKAGRA